MPPRNENGITLGAGTLYIGGEKMGEVTDATLEREAFSVDKDGIPSVIKTRDEFTANIELAKKVWEHFVRVITGVEQTMYDICPNRRVVHLTKHARKLRIRKKNYNRMIRICEKGERK